MATTRTDDGTQICHKMGQGTTWLALGADAFENRYCFRPTLGYLGNAA